MQRLLLLSLTACLAIPAAKAATIFQVNGTFFSGTTMTGTLTIDTTTGLALLSDVTLVGPHAGHFTFIQAQFTPSPGATLLQLGPVAMGVPHLLLGFPVVDFRGYTGGPICIVAGTCSGGSNWTDTVSVFDGLASGSATAATPEPTSAWLLGIGLTTLGAVRRRRDRSRRIQ